MNDENPTPTPEIIQFIGLRELEPMEQDTIQSLSTEYYEKIKRELQNLTSLTVHCKCEGEHEKNKDTRKRYVCKVRVEYPGQIIEGHVDTEWELPLALHKVFTDVFNQIRHKYHTGTTRPDSEHNKDIAAEKRGERL